MASSDDFVTVLHDGHEVHVHAISAETYRLEPGQEISDMTLRNVVRCTQAIGRAHFRLLTIMNQMPKLRQ